MKVWLILISLFLLFPAGPIMAAEAVVDPTTDPRCWTEEICTNDADRKDGPDGRFADSNDKASNKACNPDGNSTYRFCYPPPMEYELGVSLPIAGRITASVTGLGDYVDKTYKFLLSIATIFAVLMLMVGGLQYVSSPGGGEISKAKERITKALTGLVLLMCAALILFTVNPQLIKLEMPQIPKMQGVMFISDSTSCESIQAKGIYTLEPTTGKCGSTVSKLVKENGKDVPEAEQKTCHWNTCPETYQKCTRLDPADRCLACEEMNQTIAGLAVDSSACSQYDLRTDTTGGNGIPKISYECFYDHGALFGSDASLNKCVLLTLDCSSSSVAKCEDYKDQKTKTGRVQPPLGYYAPDSSDISLKTVCEEDSCGIGAKTNTKCTYSLNILGTANCASTPK
ncbi:MAG: pilin [Patescibacteria group bacterium]|jgi:hypothetical protein